MIENNCTRKLFNTVYEMGDCIISYTVMWYNRVGTFTGE